MNYDENVHEWDCMAFGRWYTRVSQAIDDGRVEEWVSELIGRPCKRSGRILKGSWNGCMRLRCTEGRRYVLRIPLGGLTRHQDDKVVREVAAMRYVRRRTRIPVPKIRAWGLSHENPLELGPFIITDFVKGALLSDVWGMKSASSKIHPSVPEYQLRLIYLQIASYMLELNKHTFDRIGSFLEVSDTGKVKVFGSPFTRKDHDIEGHSGVRVKCPDGLSYKSSVEFIEHSFAQNWQCLSGQLNSADDADDALRKADMWAGLYESAELFADKQDPNGFRLFCDDWGAHNIIVKSGADLTIIGIIDWEWTNTMPFQIFSSPPHWLAGKPLSELESGEELAVYSRLLALYLEEMRRMEAILNEPNPQLETQHLWDPSSPRLSDAIERNWVSGRVWFNELVRSPVTFVDDPCWKNLTSEWPFVLNISLKAEERDTFVAEKLRNLEEYRSVRKGMLRQRERDDAEDSASPELDEAETGCIPIAIQIRPSTDVHTVPKGDVK